MAKNQQQQTPLESLFKELDNFIQESEFKKAIKVCDKILSVQSDDADAFTCKVICLIKDSQFEQALTFLDSPNNRALSQNLAFERAYCYYSTKRYVDSLNVIKNVARPKPPRILELEAQIMYRLENFSQCITTYEDLMNTHKIDTAELKTNLLAAYSDEGRINEGISLIKNSKSDLQDSFEVAFNGACVHIANRDYKSAETLLLLAKKVCTEENSDSEETLQEELAPILVQLGYCYQMLGKNDEAMELYKEVLQSKTKTESTSAAVAANNSVVIKGSHDLFDSLKKLNKAETVEQKLSTMQKRVIGYNKCLTYLHMNKPDEVRKQIENLKGGASGSSSSSSSSQNSSWGSENEERLIIISAALLAREKKTEEAFRLLNEFKSKHDKNKSYLSTQLTLAQMYLEKNDLLKVLESLQELGLDYSHRAAIVSSIVALQEKMGNVEGAVRTLNENVLWYENLISKGSLNDIDEQAYSKVVTTTGDFHMKQKRFPEAAEMYERLVKKNRNDLIALPSLIIATTHYDPSTAEKLSKRLPPLSGDSKNSKINTDNLENSAPPKLDKKEKEKEKEKVEDDKSKDEKGKGKEKVSDKQKGKGKEVQGEKKDLEVEKKKKKKKRLPKNYNPNVRPDPERWLPKHERAAYKNRKKKHGADQNLGKGSQGVVPTSSATTVSTGNKPQPPPASSTNRIPDAKPYKPPNAGKKKKGKGGK